MLKIRPLGLTVLLFPLVAIAAPTVYPTGTTIYDPERAWNGFTVFITPEDGAAVIDMNGNLVKTWPGFGSFAGGPVRVLPGGYIMGGGPNRRPHQESNRLLQRDWGGNVVWEFDHTEQVADTDGTLIWSARQHHDWQREGLSAGYYSPRDNPGVDAGKTLVLAHRAVTNENVSDRLLEDDTLLEVSWDGDILWQWRASDHIDEMGFSPRAREIIRAASGFSDARGSYDWLHVNSATWLGPNPWYDAGDERFHPEHVIISSRQANIVAIIDRNGNIVWRLGPDYRDDDAQAGIGQVIGQHHPHFIPTGLPGAGNLLVYDNGGAAGYGFVNPVSPDGTAGLGRAYSRVLEINPVTLEVQWSYQMPGQESFRFFSSYISSAQRLENGNTLITEGAGGRLFEVTPDGEIVWEYLSPFFQDRDTYVTNRVYRAYRLPYGWIPQLEQPAQRAVVPPALESFRIAPQ